MRNGKMDSNPEEISNRNRIYAFRKDLIEKYFVFWESLTGWRLFLFFTLHYTLLFLVLSRLVFAPYVTYEKAFIRVTDGVQQHFPRLLYISQTIRKSIHDLLGRTGAITMTCMG